MKNIITILAIFLVGGFTIGVIIDTLNAAYGPVPTIQSPND